MSVNDIDYTYPDGERVGLNDADWKRADKAVDEMKKRLAKTCKHLVKGGKPTKITRPSKKSIKADLEKLNEKLNAAEREANGYDEE